MSEYKYETNFNPKNKIKLSIYGNVISLKCKKAKKSSALLNSINLT